MKFVGGAWTPESRGGTFARFFDAHAGLERAAFLERVRTPHLVIGVDLDPRTWDQGVVIRLDRKTGEAADVTVGRDPSADVVLNCPTVSKSHVRFTREGEVWFATDLRSLRGTTLEGLALESDKKTRLEGARPRIGLGPDVNGVFLLPEELHAFLGDARKKRAEGPPSGPPPARPDWPTWSLLQSPDLGTKTDHDLPSYQPPPGAAVPPQAAPPKARFKKPMKEQFRDLFSTPQKLAFTIGVVVIVVVGFRFWGKDLLFLVFGEKHPDWLKNW